MHSEAFPDETWVSPLLLSFCGGGEAVECLGWGGGVVKPLPPFWFVGCCEGKPGEKPVFGVGRIEY